MCFLVSGDAVTKTPWQILQLLIPFSFWMQLVEQTNLYASRFAEANNGSGGRKWKPVTLQEMVLWVGLCIAMSMATQTSVEFYWLTGSRGGITYPDFGRFGMGLYRWQQIKRFFHLNDNDLRPIDRTTSIYRLWHCLPFINLLKETFKKYWRLGKKLTADERTIPSRHRQNPIRIYNPSKPYKFGMELFTLCCSTSYYCWDFIVYDKLKTPGLHSLVVMNMVRTLTLAGHTIFLDRGFTSPALIRWLGSKGHGGTGTVLPNRKGFPQFVRVDKNAAKGTCCAAVSLIGKMMAVCWKDKKPVFFLTNCHTDKLGTTQRREGAERMDVDCPEVALAYNNHKDAVDQYDKSCLSELKSLEHGVGGWKWWHRLWWGLFDGALVNASIIWRHYHNKGEDTRTEFMLQLQEEMINNRLDCTTPSQRRPQGLIGTGSSNPRLDGVGHFLKRHPAGLIRACKWCAYMLRGTKDRPSRAITYCLKCEAHLCPSNNCAEKYHSVEDPILDSRGKTYQRKKKPREDIE